MYITYHFKNTTSEVEKSRTSGSCITTVAHDNITQHFEGGLTRLNLRPLVYCAPCCESENEHSAISIKRLKECGTCVDLL